MTETLIVCAEIVSRSALIEYVNGTNGCTVVKTFVDVCWIGNVPPLEVNWKISKTIASSCPICPSKYTSVFTMAIKQNDDMRNTANVANIFVGLMPRMSKSNTSAAD